MLIKQEKYARTNESILNFEGGYQAKVTVKGVNIESSSVGDACPKPSEARGSAAAEMLAKLNSMLTPAP